MGRGSRGLRPDFEPLLVSLPLAVAHKHKHTQRFCPSPPFNKSKTDSEWRVGEGVKVGQDEGGCTLLLTGCTAAAAPNAAQMQPTAVLGRTAELSKGAINH